MALDAATLALCVKQLNEILADSKVDKIHEPTRDEILISMRTFTKTYKLLLCARSGSARVCLTDAVLENPAVPPSFCMLLRKHFGGGRLLAVRMEDGDRIVYFDFRCVNEMGDLVYNTICVELMGRYSNLVLIQNGKILDALKRVSFEDSEVRQLLPGLSYTVPEKPARPDFEKTSANEIIALATEKDMPIIDALCRSVAGVSALVFKEAVYRAFGTNNPEANTISVEEKSKLAIAIQEIKDEHANGGTPVSIIHPDGHFVDFTFFVPKQFGEDYTIKIWPSFCELLDGYYKDKDHAERMRAKGRELQRAVRNMHERALRKQKTRKEELRTSEKSDKLRLYGELLSANLYLAEKGMESIAVQNWYDEGKTVTIPLDLRYTPSENAQLYFKQYKKKQTAIRMLKELLIAGEIEIEYLKTVLYEVNSATNEQELEEIRLELKSQGYLKYYKPKTKRQKPADYRRFISSDGFEILVGRNNVQNERLSLHTARGRDLWFHTQNIAGSHVVVFSGGQAVPDQTKFEAAQLAVVFSSISNGVKVPVDYTEVKNLRKNSGLAPGMLLYDNYETAIITPEKDIVEKLAK